MPCGSSRLFDRANTRSLAGWSPFEELLLVLASLWLFLRSSCADEILALKWQTNVMIVKLELYSAAPWPGWPKQPYSPADGEAVLPRASLQKDQQTCEASQGTAVMACHKQSQTLGLLLRMQQAQ